MRRRPRGATVSIKRALVSARRFRCSLQQEIKCAASMPISLGTADHRPSLHRDAGAEGMVVNEDLDPGKSCGPARRSRRRRRRRRDRRSPRLDPSPPGPAGAGAPHRRPARISPAAAPTCASKGWMGRADQTTKVKGMFVRPSRSRRSPGGIPNWDAAARVRREGGGRCDTLRCECGSPARPLREPIAAIAGAVTKIGGRRTGSGPARCRTRQNHVE